MKKCKWVPIFSIYGSGVYILNQIHTQHISYLLNPLWPSFEVAHSNDSALYGKFKLQIKKT
jgi:hypothetical protein